MKTILLAAALLALAPLAHAADATVTLTLDAATRDAPGSSCSVTVADGASVAAVLDAAQASGCIASWSAQDYGTPGHPNRFVTCIDGVCGQDGAAIGYLEGTYWALWLDGHYATCGIDACRVHAGDTVQFTYDDYWASYTLDGTLP